MSLSRCTFPVIGVILASICLFAGTVQGLQPMRSVETETQLFSFIDKNQDGKITPQEYLASNRSWLEREPQAKSEILEQFKKYDTNRDEVITLNEFLAPVREQQQRREKP